MPSNNSMTLADDLGTAYHRNGVADLPDVQLAGHVASLLRRPRLEPADSFVLHAPLELAARVALLPFVLPGQREAARQRVFAIGTAYDESGPPAPEPVDREFGSSRDAAAHLAAAIDTGDLDAVDEAARWLGRNTTSIGLRQLLSDTIVPRLSAAAHGSIFLYQLPRVAPRGDLTGELLRPLAREVARYPDWRLRWQEAPRSADPASTTGSAIDLFEAIRATPALGRPGSDFIFPIMAQVESTGVAEQLLALPTRDVELGAASRVILRAAAWTMLQETESKPYGWSHCLTLPQAVLGIAPACTDGRAAVSIAATYVVGFRAALAQSPLDPNFVPDDPGVDVPSAIETAPDVAAAAAWHASASARGSLVTELATRAAVHHDAHFAKYTLACLDAAAFDPTYSHLYLAAAASLAGYWAQSGSP